MGEVTSDEGGEVGLRDPSRAKVKADPARHPQEVQRILEAAIERDIEAEARDQVSVERDRAADLEAFTSTEGGEGYGADLPARRHAAMDRRDAKGDRDSAADDRAALTGVVDRPEEPEEPEVDRPDLEKAEEATEDG